LYKGCNSYFRGLFSGVSSTLKSGCGFLCLLRILKTVLVLNPLSCSAFAICAGVTSDSMPLSTTCRPLLLLSFLFSVRYFDYSVIIFRLHLNFCFVNVALYKGNYVEVRLTFLT